MKKEIIYRIEALFLVVAPYEIIITRPCTDVPGKFIAESTFGRKFDMNRLCELVKSIDGAKCSESLGVAKFDYKDRTFILYKSGRIDLRKVKDAEDADIAMQEIEAMFSDALEQR
jgi:ArsR family metal-binding transcriptional regulator